MFPTFGIDNRLPEKSNVLGAAINGVSIAVPFDVILAERVINTTVGGQEITVLGHPLTGVLGIFERDDTEFSIGKDPREIIDDTGAIWTISDTALTANDGRTLARLPAHELFWFAWVAFFPGTQVYTGESI